jgi:hypothetical protein
MSTGCWTSSIPTPKFASRLSEFRDLRDGLVTEIRNGKTISIRAHLDRQEALEAAGLRE